MGLVFLYTGFLIEKLYTEKIDEINYYYQFWMN
jgi:hypothetical protein